LFRRTDFHATLSIAGLDAIQMFKTFLPNLWYGSEAQAQNLKLPGNPAKKAHPSNFLERRNFLIQNSSALSSFAGAAF
jgi:hypothetical protein